MTNPRPEILAPVGNWEMCQAAVHNGADAVYLGMPGFNARGRAKTFTIDELRQIISFCHLYGVRVLLAFNILIFERELNDAEAILRDVLPLRPDALIVQDIGLIRLIRVLAPEQVIHASTQMTVTSHEAISLTEELGIHRYVLGRELSLAEIRKVKENTARELEVFVHGALCVAYSGQCLTSESFGGRSANRGQCAQACRLDYDLIVDGEVRDLGEKRYLVSPKDLCGLDEIPELCEIGVSSFKIEGRLKSPEYVAETVRAYRERRDNVSGIDWRARTQELSLAYSRGFFSGWLRGVNHQKLVDARYSNHHGLLAGTILSSHGTTVIVESSRPPQNGDGVLFADFGAQRELGTTIYDCEPLQEGRYQLRFSNDFATSSLKRGMSFFINASDATAKTVRKTFTDKTNLRRVPVHALVTGSVGAPLTLTLSDDRGNVAVAHSTQVLTPAQNAPLSAEVIEEEVAALSASPFILEGISIGDVGHVFLHRKELKEMRRTACEALTLLRTTPSSIELKDHDHIAPLRASTLPKESSTPSTIPHLFALLRSTDQIDAVEGLPLGGVYLDYEFGKEYARSVERLRAMGHSVGVATTRILKPGETGHLKVIERVNPDFVLVRNLGALQYFQDSELSLVGDFSLNVTNSLSAQWFLSKRLQAITPSYDLNQEQLLELLKNTAGASFEITMHQYMPSFHMEHCVFAAFLSAGSSFRDCGRPCEKHRVELRDRNGVSHPLKPDAECRNTMYNGTPQSAARLSQTALTYGVSRYRVEALFESPEQLRAKLIAYDALLKGTLPLENAIQSVGVLEKYGVTEGQLYNVRTWQDRKKEERRPPENLV